MRLFTLTLHCALPVGPLELLFFKQMLCQLDPVRVSLVGHLVGEAGPLACGQQLALQFAVLISAELDLVDVPQRVAAGLRNPPDFTDVRQAARSVSETRVER